MAYHYQLDPPASQHQQGDEFDDCVIWVRSLKPALDALNPIAARTDSVLTEIELQDDDTGIDFTLPDDELGAIEAWLSRPRSQEGDEDA